MADTKKYISQLKLADSTVAFIKDSEAWSKIETIEKGGILFIGRTTTALTDGATTNPIVIDGESVTAKNGNLAIYNNGTDNLEFIWDAHDTANAHWTELGSTGKLGLLAYKDSAEGKLTTLDSVTASDSAVTGTITTAVSVADITDATAVFTGKEATISSSFKPTGTVTGTIGGTTTAAVAAYTPAGDIAGTITGSVAVTMQDYTPEGTVTAPSITVTPTTGSVLASATYDETNELLTFASGTVMTAASAALDANPTFSGTAKAPAMASGTCSTTVDTTDNKLTFTGETRNGYNLEGSCSTVVDGTTGKTLTFAGENGTATATYTPEATSVAVNTIELDVTNGTVTHNLTAAAQVLTPSSSEKTITVE